MIYKQDKPKDSENKVKVKVKALEPPKFTGELRDYPSFKDDFTRIIEEHNGKDPFALKQCLCGDALNCITGCENDYDEMFMRLDEQYGNPRKVVDVVIGELNALKPLSVGVNKEFIKMVRKVEQCWLDLKRVILESEIYTAHVVSMVERILPYIAEKRMGYDVR
ncbi:hypothetical protein Pcinc_018772 [Petrolisthes cinctipes]|uniref:Uncharacterized protein n=1 Tax=Petrolisthes cinctipes TaxID=88211 RepID=A0AAE1KIM3_PETCI|nr:hypothetical protein Pcinc_018772 [Petrolisthes cinctipes]